MVRYFPAFCFVSLIQGFSNFLLNEPLVIKFNYSQLQNKLIEY